MPPVEAVPTYSRREEPAPVRFVWTTAGRVRRLPSPGEAKLAESIARLFDREAPLVGPLLDRGCVR